MHKGIQKYLRQLQLWHFLMFICLTFQNQYNFCLFAFVLCVCNKKKKDTHNVIVINKYTQIKYIPYKGFIKC